MTAAFAIPSARVRPRFVAPIVALLGLLGGSASAGAYESADPAPAATRAPARSAGEVVPLSSLRALTRQDTRAERRAPGLSTADTLTVFHADFEGLVSPNNEGGWTHTDKSGVPTAWHIASTLACQGSALWAGLIDSSWTGDPDRNGYDNNWEQTVSNYVDLTGAVSPVKLGFKHRLNLEAGYDFARVEVFDPEYDWTRIANFTGDIPSGAALCDTFSIQIPDSIIAKSPVVQFRFVLSTDIQGSSADGLYPDGEGWSVDNVTVRAGASDLRFFDDMEAGIGAWVVSTFPAVGDFWRVSTATNTQQLCTTNVSKAWTPSEPVSGVLVARMDDQLLSPRIPLSGPDQVFLTFDVYRSLSLNSCFFYSVAFRSKEPGSPWSNWIDPTGLLYFGDEREWLRQNIPLPGAAGAESLQVRITVKDYAAVFCGGISSTSGTALFIDNLDIRVLGQAGPAISTSESSLMNDTFRTTAFLGNDNFNTPRGDSTTVRIAASSGLQEARFYWSVNGAPFASSPMTAVGAAAPDLYYGDVPAGAYPRGSTLRYYFSATDAVGAVATLPIDAPGNTFTATVLPAVFTPTAACPGDTARVLYVNSFAGPEGGTGVDQSLAALGIRYDRFDVNAAADGLGNTPGGSDPASEGVLWPGVTAAALAAMYSAVIWDVGERSSFTLRASDQALLTSWLGSLGKNRGLILSGDNLAYDLSVNGEGVGTFLSCTIGATYARDTWETLPQDSLTPSLAGGAGTRIAQEPFPLNGNCPGLNRFDAISVAPCVGAAGRAWLRYPNNLIAATERRAQLGSGPDSLRAILLGFSLSTMPNATRRNLFLWRTLVEEMETPYCTTPTGIETASSPPAPVNRIDPPAPNPFNPSTAIRFAVARAGHVRLTVYNVAGARIRVLVDGVLPAGEHLARWDGKDDRGHDVGSAAYFIRMEGEGASASRKAVLLR